MVVNKNKKKAKHRGHNTHGHGASKKHRGAGSRGGRGNAGTGKRAGQKKAGLKNFKLGKIKGFLRRRGLHRENTINVGCFTSKTIEKYVQAGQAKKEGAFYVLDLTALGYYKLLGTGSTDLKLRVSVVKCSAQAVEKVKAAGGEVLGAETTEE
jgi:large subunit ribosomal protein L15